MGYKMTFKRYELKYLISRRQRDELMLLMKPYMALDEYGHTTIRNIYYDTESFRLVRRSNEKPEYKEKLRVRSYAPIDDNGTVFVELKKKYDSVVYKRRISLTQKIALECLAKRSDFPKDTQISREIKYFCDYYKDLRPAMFLSYEREAWFPLYKSDLRITFDENILYRTDDFSFANEVSGEKILGDDDILMEIKTASAIPLWLTKFLSENKIYKTSFSKYGLAYKKYLGGKIYA